MAVGAAPAADSPVRLPSLGESASDEFSLGAEKRLGEQIMRQIRPDPAYLDDPALLEYLQSVWLPLVHSARERGDIGSDVVSLFAFEAFLVRDRSVNAFALPGGYVGVHLGLIAIAATRDELASVLAHELTHVTQRHIARSVSSSQRSSVLGMAAMILGLLAASRASSPDAAQAAIAGGQALIVQSQLNFSRDMEREADRIGQSLMQMSGYAPTGMVAMFGRLEAANRLNDAGQFPYLRSHPLTVDRIGEAQQRATFASAPPAAGEATRRHALMQARARVLMDPSTDAVRRWQDLDVREGLADERLAGLYGSALASTLLRDFARAQSALATAQALPAWRDSAIARREFALLAAQLGLARGDAAAAQRALGELAADASRPAVLARAQVALADGDPDTVRRSTEALQTWVAEHRQDAGAWQLLAQCAERQGQALRALRAAAEAQAALGNLGGAIDRLRAGQALARGGTPGTDFIEASVIDARLRDLMQQRRELEREQRGERGGRLAGRAG